MEQPFTMKIGSEITEIPKVSAQLDDAMSRSGFSSEDILDTQLAVEEVISNTINHGYRGPSGNIDISFRITSSSTEIDIADTAPPFDPLSLPEPDLSGDVSDRKIGGLGVFLVRQVMDDVRYRREGKKNILTLVKKKNP
ncbi:MAG: ATP-binding protein [Methanoregula sp.]|nr:ATP-binding protein [Methanoregula sp.]